MNQLLRRAADFVDRLSTLYVDAIIQGDGTPEDAQDIALQTEMVKVRDELLGLAGKWVDRVKFTDARSAAEIIANMLKDWRLPGAVWYESKCRRFRLVGDGYAPSKTEVCVGVYLPDAGIDMLVADFESVMRGGSEA